jgi:DNA-binding CsgD family transcriptional regulator
VTKELHADLALGALDLLELGVMATDGSRRLLFHNRSARDLLDRGACLQELHGHLRGANPALDRKLAALLHRAAESPPAGACLSLAAGREAYFLVALPLKPQRADALLLYVANPLRQRGWDAGLLGEVIGLSPAEARLAGALASGSTLREHAEASKVAPSTLRTQLRQIFVKTGLRRQADLIALLSQLPRGWRR